eukprot:scaffold3104_cov145-Skeletonema_menzelii.AAC.6
MFRDLVSPRSTAAAELEAITSERDFFKEKYAAHASEMEAMKTQLKESQRMVDKLRNQVLDLSQQVMELKGEKSLGGAGGEQDQVNRASSLAEISNCAANTDNAPDSQQPTRNSIVSSELSAKSVNKKQTDKEDENSEKENNVENEEVDSEDEGESEGGSDEDDDDSHDNDEAEAIRLKASRMLAWASYQSSTRRTPTKTVDDSDEGEIVMNTPTQPITGTSVGYSLPTKVQSLLDDDEDTDASSLVEQHQVASDSKVRGGKNTTRMGKFVNNLKDMMGTQSESDSSYEEDHDDYESSSESECSNLSENLARMQLDVRFADGQDEH